MVEQKAQPWCLCSSEWLFQLRSKALELFLITRAALWQPTQKCSLGAGKVADPCLEKKLALRSQRPCAVEQQREGILVFN